MIVEREDLQQEIALRKLMGKKQTDKQVLFDMIRSAAYSNSPRARYHHLYIIDDDSVDFEWLFAYEVDYDSAMDYEQALSLVSERRRSILRLWSEGYTGKEIAGQLGTTESNISILKSRAIKEIRKKWHIAM